MKRAVKTAKRIKLLKSIAEDITSHERFEENVKRKSLETETQLAVFQRLEKVLLKDHIIEYLNCSDKHAQSIVTDNFKWEGDTNTTVHHFIRFGKQHRPDAILEIDNLKIAIEIKQGDNGSSLRSGLGQCILYSSVYDFTIYVFVDKTKSLDIKNTRSEIGRAHV